VSRTNRPSPTNSFAQPKRGSRSIAKLTQRSGTSGPDRRNKLACVLYSEFERITARISSEILKACLDSSKSHRDSFPPESAFDAARANAQLAVDFFRGCELRNPTPTESDEALYRSAMRRGDERAALGILRIAIESGHTQSPFSSTWIGKELDRLHSEDPRIVRRCMLAGVESSRPTNPTIHHRQILKTLRKYENFFATGGAFGKRNLECRDLLDAVQKAGRLLSRLDYTAHYFWFLAIQSSQCLDSDTTEHLRKAQVALANASEERRFEQALVEVLRIDYPAHRRSAATHRASIEKGGRQRARAK